MSEEQTLPAAIQELIRRVDTAVTLGDLERVTGCIKQDLEQLCRTEPIVLPERFRRPIPDCYARRLLHRAPDLAYTMVVMTWGPGQRTPLHDHAGMWCVECVLEGRLDVTQYELTDQRDGRYRFDQKATVQAGIGQAGCLIPPYEYHVLGNGLSDSATITLHVYGGEMDHCNLFTALPGGWWEKSARELQYHG